MEITSLFSTDPHAINDHYQAVADDLFHEHCVVPTHSLTEAQIKKAKKPIKVFIANEVNKFLKQRQKELESILKQSLKQTHSINIENMKKRLSYIEPKPKSPQFLKELPQPIRIKLKLGITNK